MKLKKLFLQLFVSSRIRKIGKNMTHYTTTAINRQEVKTYKYRDYSIIYSNDDVKLLIDKRELKINLIEKLYLKVK